MIKLNEDAVESTPVFIEDTDGTTVFTPSSDKPSDSHNFNARLIAAIFNPRSVIRSIFVNSVMRPSLISPSAHAIIKSDRLPRLSQSGVIWNLHFAIRTFHFSKPLAPQESHPHT